MTQVMEPPVAAPPGRRTGPPRRRRRPRVPSVDVCFGTKVFDEVLRIVDGDMDPNPALVAPALDALDTVVHPTAEHHARLRDGEVVVCHLDTDELRLLWELLAADERPDAARLTALRRRLERRR